MNSQVLAMAAIKAISFAEGEPPEKLGYNLYDYIDLDVLDTLDNGMNTAWEFSFEIPDHTVRVTSDEQVFIDGVPFEVTDPALAKNGNWPENYR